MRETECRRKLTDGIQGKMGAALAGLLAAALLTGCGAAGKSAADMAAPQAAAEYNTSGGSTADAGGGMSYGMESGYYPDEPMEEEISYQEGQDSGTVLSDRKLIRTVDMEVETKEADYDAFLSSLEKEVQALGGYVENMDSYNGSNYGSRNSRYASLTLRIPKDRLDGFLELVSDISNVVRRSDNVEDVTLQYVDMESRRNALRTEQDRLLELLAMAEDIEDIITIEERLSFVRYQLESMESQLRTLDNQVDFSTVRLEVREVRELTPVAELTVWERISGGFVDSLKEIGDDAVDVFVWVLVNSPYLVLWMACAAAVIVLLRSLLKKKGKSGKKSEDKSKKDEEK